MGFERRDTQTSLTMGLGNVAINVGWKLLVLAIYAGLYELAPIHLDPGNPLTWVALFFADDSAYYWFHRVSHENRVFWASHVVHHSSVRRAPTWRERAGHMWHGPGWRPVEEEAG